jgi:hypothetical protein
MQTHLEHKCLFVRQKWLPMENLHAIVQVFQLILLEIETGKALWRIIIKQELT